jgi:hypothetical protein
MARSLLLCVLSLALGACRQGPKACVYDTGCNLEDFCSEGFCAPRDGGAGGGAGSGGGAGGSGGSGAGGGAGGSGGSGGGSVATCAPACAAWDECVGAACAPRYAALQWNAPAEGRRFNAADGGLAVAAALALAPGRTAAFPATLEATLQRPSGADVAFQLAHAGAGGYSGVAPFAAGATEGAYALALAPFAGLDAGVRSVLLDRTPPGFSVVLEAAPVRLDDGGLAERDPGLPSGQHAFRRDESLDVAVTCGDSDVSDAGFAVTVLGVLADGGAPPSTGAATPLASGCRVACGAGCRCFRLDASAPQLEAVRATLAVQATVTDEAGNVAGPQLAGSPWVTRWKWKRAATGSNVRASPAVGRGGDLYLSLGSTAVALSPAGATRWSLANAANNQTFAVGVADGGEELAFFGRSGGNASGALRVSTTEVLVDVGCAFVSSPADLAPALLWTSASSESALTGVYVETAGATALRAHRPLAANETCASTAVTGTLAAPGNLVATGSTVITLGQSALVGFTHSSGGWAQSAGAAGVGNALTGVALDVPSSSALVSGDTLARAPLPLGQGGAALQASGSSWGRVAVSAPGAWWAGSNTAGGMLHRFGPNLADGGVALAAPLLTAPVIGASGLIYLVDESGNVEARTRADLTLRWRLSLGEQVRASPNLDVSRTDAGAKRCPAPGVLYVVGASGSLYALLVDSAGVEPTAPWPKDQHDPRNSGNADFSLGEFTCP